MSVSCFRLKKKNKMKIYTADFENYGFGISVIDLTDFIEDLRCITIQFYFKKGIAIFYKIK